jgi:excisionase family DNA binding protein
MTEQNSKLLTRKEASDYLGIAQGTLEVWACTKRYQLPYIKVGRLVRYRLSDLDTFLNSRVITA